MRNREEKQQHEWTEALRLLLNVKNKIENFPAGWAFPPSWHFWHGLNKKKSRQDRDFISSDKSLSAI